MSRKIKHDAETLAYLAEAAMEIKQSILNNPSCDVCRFYKRGTPAKRGTYTAAKPATCHRHAPKPTSDPAKTYADTVWPCVNENDICGEWEPDNDAIQRFIDDGNEEEASAFRRRRAGKRAAATRAANQLAQTET